MNAIGQLAVELGAPERTLRRVVALGAVRCRRPGARRLRLADGELGYLRSHWGLLTELREALRTERRVRIAILVGSMARGDDHSSSDIDLLVDLEDEAPLDRMRLAMRLGKKMGREVDVASLTRTRELDPLAWLQTLDEGRVIVDRDGAWPELRKRRPAVYRRAMRSYHRQQADTAEAVESLLLR